jgi:hypothetical protein
MAHRHAYVKEAYLCGDRDAQEMNKTDVLVTDNLDLINQAKAAKVVAELLLCRTLVQPAEIDIAACIALANGERNLARHGRRLAPSNLELLAVEGKFLDGGIRMKCRGSGTIEEGKKNARLFREDADGL